MISHLIDNLPPWGVLISTVLFVLIAIEAGFRLGRYRSNQPGFDSDPQINSITGAHLGLLAFILAFSFSMAAAHFDARKQAVLEEVKTIETTYMRSQLIGGVHGDEIMDLLRQYVAVRSGIGLGESNASIIDKSEIIHQLMWQQVHALVAAGDLTVIHSLLVQSMSQTQDLHQDRVSAGLRDRIPSIIWTALYVVLLLSMTGMGFQSGLKRHRSTVPNFALALSFSMVMFLIADLDRPDSGLVKSDQSVMLSLNNRLQQANQLRHPGYSPEQ